MCARSIDFDWSCLCQASSECSCVPGVFILPLFLRISYWNCFDDVIFSVFHVFKRNIYLLYLQLWIRWKVEPTMILLRGVWILEYLYEDNSVNVRFLPNVFAIIVLQFLWIVHFWLPIRYPLFIQLFSNSMEAWCSPNAWPTTVYDQTSSI